MQRRRELSHRQALRRYLYARELGAELSAAFLYADLAVTQSRGKTMPPIWAAG